MRWWERLRWRHVETAGVHGRFCYELWLFAPRWSPGGWCWAVFARACEPDDLDVDDGAVLVAFGGLGGPCPSQLDAEAAALHLLDAAG